MLSYWLASNVTKLLANLLPCHLNFIILPIIKSKQMLRVYGVGGKLLKVVQSFYVHSRTCVRAGMDVSEWIPINIGLRQGCVNLCDVSMVV